jgi:hypothetical protein
MMDNVQKHSTSTVQKGDEILAEMNKRLQADRQIQPKSQNQKQVKWLSAMMSEGGHLLLYVED